VLDREQVLRGAVHPKRREAGRAGQADLDNDLGGGGEIVSRWLNATVEERPGGFANSGIGRTEPGGVQLFAGEHTGRGVFTAGLITATYRE
jgi:hypothetical protein